MQVVGDARRPEREQSLVQGDVRLERAVRLEMIQVAQVMAEDRPAVAAQREGRLELPADRQDRHGQSSGSGDRLRGVPARAADRRFDAADHPRHRIIAAHMDRPVVGQENVGDAGQPLDRVRLVDRRSARPTGSRWSSPAARRPCRAAADDAAACREASRRANGFAGCDAVGQGRIRRALRQQDDRPARGRRAAPATAGSISHNASAAATSRTITANGFSSRCLRRRSSATAAVVPRVADQVISAQPLHRADFPAAHRRHERRRADRRFRSRCPAASSDCNLGPQAGQAVGWAWNRRSAGSSYSARQRGHIAKPRHRRPLAVVRSAVTIVSRGPQLVQLRNG